MKVNEKARLYLAAELAIAAVVAEHPRPHVVGEATHQVLLPAMGGGRNGSSVARWTKIAERRLRLGLTWTPSQDVVELSAQIAPEVEARVEAMIEDPDLVALRDRDLVQASMF
jgi:predicted lipid carrier protein YhbT